MKFVLVDPKKVELNIYNKIERHYLAKLPDSEDAIITDNTKVIHTLNSLCIEMDNRYELLKNGMCRNIKEYNTKFKARKLNPDDGHVFLPYIVLVVDEFADLIMTAGKEVETPIARLAQLARAFGWQSKGHRFESDILHLKATSCRCCFFYHKYHLHQFVITFAETIF